MSKTFTIGQAFENGIVIIDGPFTQPGQKNRKYLVRCSGCGEESLKWSNSIKNLVYGCKKCYDKSMRRSDQRPAQIRAFLSVRSNAKARGLSVEISLEEYIEIASRDCAYCGARPTIKTPSKSWQSVTYLNGIDRIDNNVGYTVGNCAPCCAQCNWAKKDLTQKEFVLWANRIASKSGMTT